MELADYLRLLLRGWVLLLLGALLGLAVAAAYLITQPVLYTASARSYISISSAGDVSDAAAGAAFAKSAATDVAEIADSPYVLDGVRTALNVDIPLQTLADQVQTTVLPNSAIIEISATTTRPALSSAIANAVAVQIADAVTRLNPNVGNASSIARSTVIRQASTPTEPSAPAVTFSLGLGLLAGFGLAVLFILLRQSVDQRVRSEQQLARIARTPVIGAMPVVPPAHEGARAVLDPAVVGRMRSVRSEILEGATQNRVIVLTGAERGESTAAVAAAVAASVANSRLTVLLLDASSASAPAAPIFDVPAEPGLTEVLARTRSADQLIQASSIANLWYLAPGRPSEQRDDLMASYEMTDLLESLAARFAVVVINTDSLEDAPTARVLGRQSDGVVLISEMNRASVPEVRRASESLERGGVRLLGAVLMTPEQRASRRRAVGVQAQRMRKGQDVERPAVTAAPARSGRLRR